MMRTAVMGARAAPQRRAHADYHANADGRTRRGETTSPKAAPAIAPMNSVGAKTHEPPMLIVNDV